MLAGINSSLFRGLGSYRDSESLVRAALERLATGRRINRAGDDPSGLVAVNDFKARGAQIERRVELLERENLRWSAQEGGMSVLGDLLLELEGLVVRGANSAGNSDEQRRALQVEADSIIRGIETIANTTIHNGEQIMSGFHAASLGRTMVCDGDDTVTYSIADLASGGALNLSSDELGDAQRVVRAAIGEVSIRRAAIGAAMNRNESEARVLLSESESVEQARSVLEDADIAREMATLVRGRILQQAAVQTLQIGDVQAKTVLTLLGAAAAA